MDRWLVILILGQFAFTGFIIWLIARSREGRRRLRSEERSRLMERFSSGQELTDFLNSPAGAHYVELMGGRPAHPVKSLSGAVTAGIILISAGCACMLLPGLLPQSELWGLWIPGVLGILVGVGILISAAVSSRLYRRAGLMSAKPRREGLGEEP